MKSGMQEYIARRDHIILECERSEEQYYNNIMRLNSFRNKYLGRSMIPPLAVPRLFTAKNSTVMEMIK